MTTKQKARELKYEESAEGYDDWVKGYDYCKKEILEKLNQVNIHVSDSYFNERCENCEKHIEASIHHFIDMFYKEIKKEIEKQ
jgi:hypothetical protein